MNTSDFDQATDRIRRSLENEKVDYMVIFVNSLNEETVEALFGFHSDKRSISDFADVLYEAASEGNVAASHFISRLLANLIHSVEEEALREKEKIHIKTPLN